MKEFALEPFLALCRVLEGMNRDFGKGRVTSIELNVDECDENGLYGKVIRDGDDARFFKMENGYVTFLSRRRKLR